MKLLLTILIVFDLLTVAFCQCGPCFPAHMQDMYCSAGHVILAIPMNVTSKIVKGGRDTYYQSLVLSVLRYNPIMRSYNHPIQYISPLQQGLPPLRQGDTITLVSGTRNGAGCKTFTMRLFRGYIIGAQLNQNGDQMHVRGCGMNKLISRYTSCELDLLFGEEQGLGYDCSCQVMPCPQHQADAGLCISNDKCFYQGPANKNTTANCKRGFDGKCNWNACQK